MAALVSSVSPAALAARLAPGRAWIMDRWSIRGPLPVAATAAFSAGGGSGEEKRRRLVLYKKPGCCLCDGLEEKLHAALSLAGGPHSLPSVDLQVRDITGNPEWEMLYQYEIPVLAKVLPDGTEDYGSMSMTSGDALQPKASHGATKHFRGYPLVSRWSLFRKKLPLHLKTEKFSLFLGGCDPYTRMHKGCPICLSLNNASQLLLLCCCYAYLLLDFV
ncbi:uncharacterized protein LOC135595147 isoform X1 [Musa acuminata AAA Group]|uniref:uncharacterized protein LOC135595147 isoform X1 n=1 Tax=Musa acuminata AAA Group TaxID=214697 RepID=UPI0031D12D59